MLRAVSVAGATPTMTYYFGPFVHEGLQGGTSSLKYIMTPEGRIINTGTDNSPIWSWEYNLTDHLGNVRVVIAPLGTAGFSTLLQQTHYYPYGMRMSQISTSENTTNNYLFGGKQLERNFDLGWYDFKGRGNYDPALGIWRSPDPMAEKDYAWTPYRYGFDNPLRFWDVGGKFEMDRIQAQQYKRLALFLQSEIKNVASNNNVVSGLMKYGQLSEGKIKNDFQWGNGPKIIIKDISSENAWGLFSSETPDILYINQKEVEKFEKTGKISSGLLLFLTNVILHEYTHYGDYLAKDHYQGETGEAFSLEVFGGKPNPTFCDFFLEIFAEQEEKQKDKEKEKQMGVSLSNLINNFSNLEEGKYNWNGSEWVKQ